MEVEKDYDIIRNVILNEEKRITKIKKYLKDLPPHIVLNLASEAIYHLLTVSASRNSFTSIVMQNVVDICIEHDVQLRTPTVETLHNRAADFIRVHKLHKF
jgi:hypothetical protein